MGRSVATHHLAEAVFYLDVSDVGVYAELSDGEFVYPCDDAWSTLPEGAEVRHDDSGHDWAMFVEGLRACIADRWPSLEACEKYMDRELLMIAANRACAVVLSCYDDIASISLVPRCLVDRDGSESLHRAWIARIEGNFRKMLLECHPGKVLVKRGHMSNGCGVYERIVVGN